jgi:hypothetical protein
LGMSATGLPQFGLPLFRNVCTSKTF